MDTEANLSRELLHLDTISRLTADNEALRKEAEAFRGKLAEACGKLMVAEARVTVLEAQVGRLRASLRDQFCPRPCNWRPSEFDVGDCVDAGECGCSARSALANEEAGG